MASMQRLFGVVQKSANDAPGPALRMTPCVAAMSPPKKLRSSVLWKSSVAAGRRDFDRADCSALATTFRRPILYPSCEWCVSSDGQREGTHLRWGLIPHWARGKPMGNTINARIETLRTNSSFRDRVAARATMFGGAVRFL